MDKSFDPAGIEQRWYETWERNGYFRPAGSGEPYCIMLPPPNVTGRLHMGHAFQDTIMDALVRYHRMCGRNTLWQGGTDHAGIATQMVVERQLAADGHSRHDLGREKFVEAVWAWKQESGDVINQQLRRIGCSLDWDTARFTMDEGMSRAVITEFVELYRAGLIYRGKRLVNWDPVLHTALSDLEVEQSEESGHLWHLRYPRSDGKGHVVVATTRPETMLGDTAVAVHPGDERYADLVGLEVELPLTGRRIPVIADDYVDMEFGTGCVKITPAHDFNDYEIGRRHELELINVLTPDAKLSDAAPEAYRGLDRFEARKRIVADLQRLDLVEAIEAHRHAVPRGDRSGAVLEPFLTDQWYVKIQPLAKPAIEAVENGRIRFVPENWANTYFEWMRNIQDWCISRQLWWGHRIPAWYDTDGNIYVGRDEADARAHHDVPDHLELAQDPDVLDTWFSSALWPFSTLGWPEQTDRLKAWYPGSVLVTGFDIIFFWVARMVMAGLRFMGEVPFHEVYIHGLVRDAHGQKMSKSKGNILDPLDLIDGIDLASLIDKRTSGLMQPRMAPAIEKATREEFPNGIKAYGTDALRFTFAALATTGRDIRLDPGRIEGYRNFCNKLWNAARYVLMNMESETAGAREPDAEYDEAARWIRDSLQHTTAAVRTHFAQYRFDLAAQALYEFTWNQYCDWYLELSKTSLREGRAAVRQGTRRTLVQVLEQLLRLMHPIMPFITEEIWQRVAPVAGVAGDSVMLQPYPAEDPRQQDRRARADILWLQEVILGVRRIRAEMNIEPRRPLALLLQAGDESDRDRATRFADWLKSLAGLQSIGWVGDDAPESAVALAGSLRLLIPMAGLIDKDAEIARLEKEISKIDRDLARTETKLANRNFLSHAPATVVAKERNKAAEWTRNKEELESQLARMRAL